LFENYLGKSVIFHVLKMTTAHSIRWSIYFRYNSIVGK